MSNRLKILAGMGVLLAAVLVVQQFWPGDQETAQLPSRSDDGDDGKPQADAGGSSPSAAARTPSASAGEISYPELLTVSRQPKPADLPVLKKASRSPSWENRHAAVMGIGRLADKGDPPGLLEVLKNKQERDEVRAAAAEALGAMRHVDAGPDLIDAMSDPSELVRAAAGVAVSKIMGMKFEFYARDPQAKRQYAIDLARRFWPKFYPELKRMQNRGN